MCSKAIKTVVLVSLGGLVIGGLLFGSEVYSYMRSSTRHVQNAVKENIPLEFELQRARDLLEEIIPEMQANIKLIAQEEVEIAALKADITRSGENLAKAENRVEKLRDMCGPQLASYSYGNQILTRQQVTEKLAHSFDQFKEATALHESKKRMLASREQSLAAALDMLEKTRSQKAMLAEKIQTLESQYRLVQAASVGSPVQIDNSKLAQTEQLIGRIKKRLDVAERILAHQARFTEDTIIEEQPINEAELLSSIDEYFAPEKPVVAQNTNPATAVTNPEF